MPARADPQASPMEMSLFPQAICKSLAEHDHVRVNGRDIMEFILREPDERVAHHVTQLEAVHPDKVGYRDVLVITCKRKTASRTASAAPF